MHSNVYIKYIVDIRSMHLTHTFDNDRNTRPEDYKFHSVAQNTRARTQTFMYAESESAHHYPYMRWNEPTDEQSNALICVAFILSLLIRVCAKERSVHCK